MTVGLRYCLAAGAVVQDHGAAPVARAEERPNGRSLGAEGVERIVAVF